MRAQGQRWGRRGAACPFATFFCLLTTSPVSLFAGSGRGWGSQVVNDLSGGFMAISAGQYDGMLVSQLKVVPGRPKGSS
jgi:hypothetical protein